MTTESGQKLAYIAFFVVIAIAVTGYFVGLQSPMNPTLGKSNLGASASQDATPGHAVDHATVNQGDALPATHYRDVRRTARMNGPQYLTRLSDLKSEIDPMAEFTITPQQKLFALAMRETNRAFNGAPPTIPHPVDQMSAQACLACHGEGAKTESLRISKMSHPVLTNCTQCHVESNPTHMVATEFRESTFTGLPAPTEGPRAYPGAPPQIPHSTWMRVDCASCHGFAGPQGIRTTHPWRKNCTQCHAPSSELDQIQLDIKPQFLPSPKISN